MKLKIQLEEQDYIDAVRSVSVPTRRYIAVTLALLLGALVLAGIFANQGYAREAFIGFGALVGALVGGVAEQRLTLPRKARKIFQQQHLSRPYELGWNDDELAVVSVEGSFTRAWRDIWKARVLDKEILIFLSDANFLMVPKRSFPDASSVSTFETLLGRVTKFG